MKTFKWIDFYGSSFLIVAALVYGLIAGELQFLAGYFVVGAWQILSMLVHVWTGWFGENKKRIRYHRIVIGCLVTALVGIFVYPFLWFAALVLLFAAPIMAIYYCILCFDEISLMTRRPLAQLK
jgi:hypothetical protein